MHKEYTKGVDDKSSAPFEILKFEDERILVFVNTETGEIIKMKGY